MYLIVLKELAEKHLRMTVLGFSWPKVAALERSVGVTVGVVGVVRVVGTVRVVGVVKIVGVVRVVGVVRACRGTVWTV